MLQLFASTYLPQSQPPTWSTSAWKAAQVWDNSLFIHPTSTNKAPHLSIQFFSRCWLHEAQPSYWGYHAPSSKLAPFLWSFGSLLLQIMQFGEGCFRSTRKTQPALVVLHKPLSPNCFICAGGPGEWLCFCVALQQPLQFMHSLLRASQGHPEILFI